MSTADVDIDGEVEVKAAVSALSGTINTDAANRGANAPAGTVRKRRSVLIGLQAATESIKCKQMRAKELRDMRRLGIGDNHRYVLNLVASHLQIDVASVLEFVLDSQQGMDIFHEFMVDGGRRSVLFYYQETVVLGAEETGRSIPGHTKGSLMMRLWVTDGCHEPLAGTCVYFLRLTNEGLLTNRNIAEKVTFGVLPGRADQSVLVRLQEVMIRLFCPILRVNTDWGELDKTPQGKKTCRHFMDVCENFVHTLHSAEMSTGAIVRLKPCDIPAISSVHTADACMNAAANPDILPKLEALVLEWCKQIEQVLTESSQMRKEADDTGPMAELEHWRQLQARFNSIIEQIKSHESKMIINILHIAKSKALSVWKEQDANITDAANEAKDNMKYLYTLEKFCEPLYRSDPVAMAEGVPSLINAIRMIHSVSRYYNTSQRMTSLFIKVTNQMVKACKCYITDDGMMRVWDQPRHQLIEKLHACIHLYHSYQNSFQRTKRKIELAPGERAFDFSEMYIFGKFEAFCKRLDKIESMMNTIGMYSVLQDCCIEGIDAIANKFQHIYTVIKKKPYDILDHRKLDFDQDFTDFTRSIEDLQIQLQEFMETCFTKMGSIIQALKLLQRFEELNLPCLGVDEKYRGLFMQFGNEVEHIKKLYMKYREDPPIPRDMPPVAGKISWSRQLSRKILEPMDVFKNHPEIFKTPDARRVVRSFNRIGQVLLEFEMLYHGAWIKSVDLANEALNVPLLVRHPETKKLLVNFDPNIYQVIREAECMRKLELDVPDNAKVLGYSQFKLKGHHSQLQLLLNEFERISARIPGIFLSLMRPSLKKVEAAIRPGLISLTWTSMNLNTYFTTIKRNLKELELLIKQIMDIKSTRIDAPLKDISQTMLCDLPEGEPWSIDMFLSRTKAHCAECAVDMDDLSLKVEQAVQELIIIFIENSGISAIPADQPPTVDEGFEADVTDENDSESESQDRSSSSQQQQPDQVQLLSEDEQWLREECDELFNHFNHKVLDSVLRATKHSLDLIRKRVFFHNQMGRRTIGILDEDVASDKSSRTQFFKADMCLVIPSIVMQPSLDDIQQALNKGSSMLLEVSRGIAQWGQERFKQNLSSSTTGHRDADTNDNLVAIPPQQLKNYYKSIADHKDVSKLIMMLSSACNSFRAAIGGALQQYADHHFLWEEDRDKAVEEFVETNPILSEFKAEILKFEKLDEDVEEIPASIVVGAIELFADPLKRALKVEIRAWKMLYGRALNITYKAMMDEVVEFEDDLAKKLARPIKDLEDVRQAMAALEAVRQKQISIDMCLGPIEEAYGLLQKFGVRVSKKKKVPPATLR